MQNIESILIKQVSGHPLLPEEQEQLEAWLNQAPANQKVYENFVAFWSHHSEHQLAKTREEMWVRIEEGISKNPTSQTVAATAKKVQTRAVWFKNLSPKYWYAAILLLSIGIGFAQKLLYTKQTPPPVQQAEQIAYTVRECPKGQKLTIVLPDSSVVKLNAGSRLHVREPYMGNTREVKLEGEAFFEVVRNTEVPFVVLAGQTQTVVKGTSFNVSAYPDRERIEVAVASGLVEVAALAQKEPGVQLAPKEKAVFRKEDQTLEQGLFSEDDLAWVQGKIVFRNAPLKRVISVLENWYGISCRVEGQIPDTLRLSGEFEREALRNVLDGLSYSAGIRYQLHNSKEVIIYTNH